MADKHVVLWQSHTPLVIPKEVNAPADIVKYAQQLTARETKQIVQAFEARSFEMVSTFVLTKAISALKKQLASLGMDFIGEMLDRPDITESSPEEAITHYEAISLAQDLGMLNSTQAMRLKQTLETVTHFSSLEGPEAEEEEMNLQEAVNCLRVSIQSILGQPKIEVAQKFRAFRQRLGEETLKSDNSKVASLIDSPYFYQKTVLSILMSMLKKSKGAQIEHAIGNINIILPLLWENLRKTERFQVGQVYAVLFAEGNKIATIGLKKALTKVCGFDYVPETLRSDTFTRAAKDVLEAHEGMNNFYNEPAPMATLVSLGTTIPMPAFAKCLTATLAVRLGNAYGVSFAAQVSALKFLKRLSDNQWVYYLNECLPSDRLILEKLEWHKQPKERWCQLVDQFSLKDLEITSRLVKRLIRVSVDKNLHVIQKTAEMIRREAEG